MAGPPDGFRGGGVIDCRGAVLPIDSAKAAIPAEAMT